MATIKAIAVRPWGVSRVRPVIVGFVLLIIALDGPARADKLVFPDHLTRDRVYYPSYESNVRRTGVGFLRIEWSDADGRLVEQKSFKVRLSLASSIRFPLDLRRTVVSANHLRAILTLSQGAKDEGAYRRELETDFVVPADRPAFLDYQAIIWQPQTLPQYRALRNLGITAGVVFHGEKGAALESSLLKANLRWYVENIATDFYSAYHRWMAGKPVNWRFAQLKTLYQHNPNAIGSLIRDPSLSDPSWLAKIDQRLAAVVRAERRYRPLYYDLGDETGIADLSVAWDFDFSPSSITGFRHYLRDQYRSLDALNREWGSSFSAWDEVVPLTTRQAMKRPDGNFSAWADFKAWMDVSFARALKHGTNSIHRADRNALAGIEGAQDSGWGGYDYSRLARSVDLVEIYDDAENMAALRSFNPAGRILNTITIGAPHQLHGLWQELTRGARGAILWDPDGKLVNEDRAGNGFAKELAPVLSKIESGLGALLIASKPKFDPVAILYSPASIRTRWLLDWQPWGDAWSNRDANSDYDDSNSVRIAMQDDILALWREAVMPRFVTDENIAAGVLTRAYRVLILPRSIALSAAAARQIEAFARHGGTVLAQGNPGEYDQHSRRLARSQFAEPWGLGAQSDGHADPKLVLLPKWASGQDVARVVKSLVPRLFDVRSTANRKDVEIHSWQNGDLLLISLQRDVTSAGNSDQKDADEAAEPIELRLRRPAYVYELNPDRSFGRISRMSLQPGAREPIFLAISPKPNLRPRIRVRDADQSLKLRIRIPDRLASMNVVHIDVVRPDGQFAKDYSGNVVMRHSVETWQIPLAVNEPKGTWHIRAVNVASGQTTIAAADVK